MFLTSDKFSNIGSCVNPFLFFFFVLPRENNCKSSTKGKLISCVSCLKGPQEFKNFKVCHCFGNVEVSLV